MAEIRPFRGLRFDPAVTGDLGRVISPPYDIITSETQAMLYDASPFNVVRVELSREGQGMSRYQAAAATLGSWRESGALRRDPHSAFYVVRHRFVHDGRSLERRGLMAAVRLEPWSSGAIRPHEATHEGHKADRLELMRACRANISPIMGLYRDPGGAVSRLLDRAAPGAPVAHAEIPGGESFDLWLVIDSAIVRALREALQGPFYVADGHHRYETALSYKEIAPSVSSRGLRAADYVMASLIALNDPGLLCLPYHRLLRSLPTDAEARLSTQTAALFTSEEVDIAALGPEEAAVYFASRVDVMGRPLLGLVGRGARTLRLLRPKDHAALAALMPGRSEAWRNLSPCLFAEAILRPALGVSQQEAEAQGILSYPRDAAEAVADVRAGRQDLAFLLDGVPLSGMADVSDAGDRLPPKATYFYPKLPTGLVLNLLEGTLDPE